MNRLRIVFLLGCVFYTAGSLAEQRFQYKGVYLGSSVDEFLASHAGFECIGRSELLTTCVSEGETYAGSSVKEVQAEFIEGRFSSVTILLSDSLDERYASSRFNAVESALSKRYGVPKSHVESISNVEYGWMRTWEREGQKIQLSHSRYTSGDEGGHLVVVWIWLNSHGEDSMRLKRDLRDADI